MKVIYKDNSIREGGFNEQWVREAFWHTSAHILAQAVKRLYPDAKCAIGPAIAQGFYYDFEFSFPFGDEHLVLVEAEMKKIVKEALTLRACEVSRDEALSFMREHGEDYKAEMIENLPKGEPISFYQQGDYTEFCAGPHISNSCHVKAFRLLSVAGAYWRGLHRREGYEEISVRSRAYGDLGSMKLSSFIENLRNELEE